MELALAAPILVFALIGGIDLMRVSAIQQAVQNAARSGADVLAQDSATDDATVRAVIAAELDGTPGLHGVTVSTCIDTSPPSPSPCMVALTRVGGLAQGNLFAVPPAIGTSCGGNGAGICYVRVRVIYQFRTIVPWPLVPNVIIVDRDTLMPLLS